MKPKSTLLLLLSLITVVSAASAPTEPNDTTAELNFEMKDDVVTWSIDTVVNGQLVTYRDPGPIRPTYMAQIILPRTRNTARMIESAGEAVALATSSPVAQKLSEAQREFLNQGFAARVDTSAANIPNHYSIDFYAVSETDARVMTRALLDRCIQLVQREIDLDKKELKKRQESLKQNRVVLPEKEKQLEQAEKDYEAVKTAMYPLHTQGEAEELAKELILQMDRQSKTLDIDWAGLRGKLQVIEDYLSRPDLNSNVVETLEAQRIELLIELSGLEARRKAIAGIHDEQRLFCSRLEARNELNNAVRQLRETLKRDEETIHATTWRIENPPDYMQPPKVYQNKIFIHPIESVDAQN
jgi:hypothetical protein